MDSPPTAEAEMEQAPLAPDAAPPAPADWRSSLGPKERRIAEKFQSPDDAIRSYGELERRLGRSIVVPDADADQAEWNAFYDRLGRPARAEDYGVTFPADIPEHLVPGEAEKPRVDGFLASMHAAGATPTVVQAAIDWYFGELAAVDRDHRSAAAFATADAEAALRREWRGDYARNVGYARHALTRFGDQDLVSVLDQAGLSGAPALIRAFARIGRAVAEDDLAERTSQPASASRLGDELESLRQRPDYWSSESVQKRAREISVAIYGEQPVHSDV
jgi:hypothetical protein